MEFDSYLRFLLALIFVLGLIALVAWLGRRMGYGVRLSGKGRKRRLSVTEAMALDGRRKLLLVRRDGVEHLLLVGGTTDLLIEKDIPAQEIGPDQAETARIGDFRT